MSELQLRLNAIYALFLRETKVYFREKERIVSILVSPLLFLFVVGRGLSGTSPVPGTSYEQFIFPGILSMTILFTSVTYGLYIVWDKRLDFLKEVLAAPISRSTMFIGKSLGGMVGGVAESAVLLTIGEAFVLRASPAALAAALILSALVAFATVNLGLVIGAWMKSMEGFGLAMNLLTWPMFLLSGALFDLSKSEGWLRFAAYLDPFTYCVDLMRRALLGWSLLPPAVDLAAVLLFAAGGAALGIAAFGTLSQAD